MASDAEEKKSPGPQDIFNKIFMAKAREEEGPGTTDKKLRTISAQIDVPHSIIDEVFSWVPCQLTKDDLLKKSSMSEKIGTPKTQTRS